MAATTATIPRTGKSGSRSSSADKDYVARTRCTTLATRHPSSVQNRKRRCRNFRGIESTLQKHPASHHRAIHLPDSLYFWEK